ncbi:hypothetical protein MtrunA17_Chr4g0008471 [Medicago truncatula]|uniref:Uncharacterized protein n=1 Tax=Medicago truncatula TaxID=3880 RepID=A0A396I051_MEDTR|nr:hypothetical protein MtrunA17_Chr4g0008471 [Medicago truncatula]
MQIWLLKTARLSRICEVRVTVSTSTLISKMASLRLTRHSLTYWLMNCCS